MGHSPLKTKIQQSPILKMTQVKGDGTHRREKTLFFSLNLTTLIDAFCILVIFLLSNMQGQLNKIQINQKLTLPTSVQNVGLEKGIHVRVQNDGLTIDEKLVNWADIVVALKNKWSKDETTLIIEADQAADFELISQVLRAGGQVGFENFLFAVIPASAKVQ